MSARWISLPELEEVIGRDMARVLCRHLGGLSIYIPRNPGPAHRCSPIIGLPALQALAAYAGGYHLELPNLRRPEAEKKRIWELLDQGLTHERIAETCRVSERWVRHLAAQRRETQPRLPLPIP